MKNDLSVFIPVISSQKHLDEILLKNPSLLFDTVKVCCSSKVLFELKDTLPSLSFRTLLKKCDDEEALEELAKTAFGVFKVVIFENVNTPFDVRINLLTSSEATWKSINFRDVDKKFFKDLTNFFKTWEEKDATLVKKLVKVTTTVSSLGAFQAFFNNLFKDESLMKNLIKVYPELIRFCKENTLLMSEASGAFGCDFQFMDVLSKVEEIDFLFLKNLLNGTRFSSFGDRKTLLNVHKLNFLTRSDLNELHDKKYSSYIFILLLLAENANLNENDLIKICRKNISNQIFEPLIYFYAISNSFNLETFKKLQSVEKYSDDEIFKVLVNESKGVINDNVFTLALNLNFSLSSTLKNFMGKHPKFKEHKVLFLNALLEKFYETLTAPNAFEISLSLLETWEGSLADLAVVCNEV